MNKLRALQERKMVLIESRIQESVKHQSLRLWFAARRALECKVPAGSVIPGGAVIVNQAEMDQLIRSETDQLKELAETLASIRN